MYQIKKEIVSFQLRARKEIIFEVEEMAMGTVLCEQTKGNGMRG